MTRREKDFADALGFLALLAWLILCGGCAVTYTTLVAHKDSCAAKGLALKHESETEGAPCWVTQARMQRLVDTDPDCRAYWGDAGVDLRCDTPSDGGTDGRD